MALLKFSCVECSLLALELKSVLGTKTNPG
jgi:hypothetical protein